jgi:uncharacterized protein (DUF2141 family)
MRLGFNRWGISVCLLFLAACANIVPPDGGDKDVQAPKLIAQSVKDSQLHSRVTSITLTMDEYITVADAQKEIVISPNINVPLKVAYTYKSISVSWPDSVLLPNTTYRLNFGNAIKDINEGNVYQRKPFVFSTGSFFDSLKLMGTVWDAAKGMPDTTASVFIYNFDKDTSVFSAKPFYQTKVNNKAAFQFEGLSAHKYAIIALKDANNNATIDKGESFAYIQELINPASYKQAITLRLFKEQETVKDNKVVAKPPAVADAKKAFITTVFIDTSDLSKRVQELNADIELELSCKSIKLNKKQFLLSRDSASILVETAATLIADSSNPLHYRITTNWLPDVHYELRLQKGLFEDSLGRKSASALYRFKTKREEDYATIALHIPDSFLHRHCKLEIKYQDKVWKQLAVDHTLYNFNFLIPGTYTFAIIEDANQNGMWDTGDYEHKKQPEWYWQHEQVINAKASWEYVIDFKPFSNL